MRHTDRLYSPTMRLIALPAHFDGQSIQLDRPYPLQPNTKLVVTIIPKQNSESEAWLSFSIDQLNNAYTEEDNYPLSAIKTVNPDYEGS
ncbi:MAG: hypothetical protein ACLFT0_07950 [Spirulinaceae cyanobacterium]